MVYDCEIIIKDVSRLRLYLICFVRFVISQPQRGAGRGSYIICKSIYSQKVERLKHNIFYALNWTLLQKYSISGRNKEIMNYQSTRFVPRHCSILLSPA